MCMNNQNVITNNNLNKEQSLYERDFYQWAIHNAELLRQGRLTEIDIENIAEEIESMGRSEKKELVSRLRVLIMHLLKWQYQPKRRSKSWKLTINTQRIELNKLLKGSPSLKHNIESIVNEAFEDARLLFEDETGIDKNLLPKTCPYTLEQLKEHDFWIE
ncbi:MAG: DUF29 domain-containing protein [Candidatus Magnetoovum sp. WYHC-5]|nr:DUF29 domain-containing protein [Candidatus Magnetoovum sp. WYHC-5]